MALWLVRAGKHGGYEEKFLNDKKIYLCWNNLCHDLSNISSQAKLRSLMQQVYPDNTVKKNINQGSQIWAFSHRMKVGDWVALPSKFTAAIHFGKITGEYTYNSKAKDPFYHYRKIDWFATDIPRSNFDQDILYSLGAFMTICQIKRNNAEQRIKKMAEKKWKSSLVLTHIAEKEATDEGGDTTDSFSDLEELALDQIAKTIIAKFKGYKMALLVDGILKAQGYTTFISPEGPDRGVDILAGMGPMGFEEPRICVQVKSGDNPLDRPTLDQLIGTMQNIQATQGLLVSWGGYKSTVNKEEAAQFFRVRLWDQKNLIEQLLRYYDKLDADLKADLPLKRIWTIANPEPEDD